MKKYLVFNKTDMLYASPDAMTEQQADEFIKQFPRQFDYCGGFYFTARQERIRASDVVLEKQPIDDAGDDGVLYDEEPSTQRNFRPTIDHEDDLMDRQREDGPYPFFDFACIWAPTIQQLLHLATTEQRLPYIRQMNNLMIKTYL